MYSSITSFVVMQTRIIKIECRILYLLACVHEKMRICDSVPALVCVMNY
jgi:hypothetical protein